MKLIKQLLLGAVIISIVSCKGKNALAFNEKMVSIQNEMLTKVNKMQGDTSDAGGKLKAVSDFAKLKREEIKSTQAPDGGEAFKEAMLNDVNAVIDSYDVLLKIVSAGEDETKLAPLREEFAGWQKKLEDLDEKVQEEQRKFAKANNILLK